MYVTETRRLARRHIKHTGKGNHIFNDRLVNGCRSLKVWGWDLPQYESFQLMLKGAGIKSQIVELKSVDRRQWGGSLRRRYRIHVYEDISDSWMDNG